MDSCAAVAYPGLPVVFAEGFGDYGRRVSAHSHASLALTDAEGGVNSTTTVRKSGETSFTLNGEGVRGPRALGVLKMAGDMLALAGADFGVEVKSVNNGIYSGSSDSGAAAAATALNGLLNLGLSDSMLCEHARWVSETAYRSVYGGLSGYFVDGGVSTGRIVGESFFRGVGVYACPFDLGRHSADDLHLGVVKHPDYGSRKRQAGDRILALKQCVLDGNREGVLRLMELEARTVHRMFEEVGLTVIHPPMRAVCKTVEDLRSGGVKAYWNVAGGSVVYVFSLVEDSGRVAEALRVRGITFRELRVAGGARLI